MSLEQHHHHHEQHLGRHENHGLNHQAHTLLKEASKFMHRLESTAHHHLPGLTIGGHEHLSFPGEKNLTAAQRHEVDKQAAINANRKGFDD
jgi:hypothetical protein